MCVHTKLATYPWRLRADDFVAACEESKRRTGGVALVGQHWSAESYGLGFLQDPAVYKGLAACVTRGLARGVGLSNLGPRGLRRAADAVNAAGAPVATHQTRSLCCAARRSTTAPSTSRTTAASRPWATRRSASGS